MKGIIYSVVYPTFIKSVYCAYGYYLLGNNLFKLQIFLVKDHIQAACLKEASNSQ